MIEFSKEEDIQKMLCLNGRKLRGGMPLRVQQVNQYMTVMEVFEWVGGNSLSEITLIIHKNTRVGDTKGGRG